MTCVASEETGEAIDELVALRVVDEVPFASNNDVHVSLAKGGVSREVEPAVLLARFLPLFVADLFTGLHRV